MDDVERFDAESFQVHGVTLRRQSAKSHDNHAGSQRVWRARDPELGTIRVEASRHRGERRPWRWSIARTLTESVVSEGGMRYRVSKIHEEGRGPTFVVAIEELLAAQQRVPSMDRTTCEYAATRARKAEAEQLRRRAEELEHRDPYFCPSCRHPASACTCKKAKASTRVDAEESES